MMFGCVAALFALASATAQAAAPVVQTASGPVAGAVSGGLARFMSIPFAAPPVGDLRFAAPQRPTSWSAPLNVTAPATPCPQLKLEGALFVGGEDCLQLTVLVPEAALPPAHSAAPLPVMVYLFGGAYILGDSSEFGFYDASNLALSRNVIVVSPNYRVGPFGFTALEALRAEDADNSTGNAAMQDQRLALEWVRDNIAGFGGDPSRVTIFGESAGGFSICYHLVSPASAGLFQAAIMESGSCDTTQFFQSIDMAESFSTLYGAALGCNVTSLGAAGQLACLRGLAPQDVLKSVLDWLDPAWPFVNDSSTSASRKRDLAAALSVAPAVLPPLGPMFPWGPAVDGTPAGLPNLPIFLLRAGTFNKVPLILGTNHDEGSIFVPLLPIVCPGTSFPPANLSDIKAFIERMLSDPRFNASAVAAFAEQAVTKEYNVSSYVDQNYAHLGSDMLTDFFFACSARRTARAVAAGGVPVFLYQFSYALSWLEAVVLGDYHSSELNFVFANAWPPILHTFSSADLNMSAAFTAFWTNHAGSGDPNKGGNSVPLAWPRYEEATDVSIRLALPLSTVKGMGDERHCQFWDSVFDATVGTL
jgi:para-nitrobenzyl esterase